MKLSSSFYLFVVILFNNYLFSQNIIFPNNYNDLDGDNNFEFIIKINNQRIANKEITNHKIRFDSIHFFNNEYLRLRYSYQFDDNQNTEADFYTYLREDKFEPTAFFIFWFNEKNLLTEISYSDPWDGDPNVPGNNEINWSRRATYNEDNKVKFYSYFLLHEGEEFLINEYDHIYDSEGLLSELNNYSYLNGVWTLTNVWNYSYKKNLLSEAIKKIRDEDDNWVTTDSITYVYYPDNKLKTSSRQTDMNIQNGSTRIFTFLYEYDELDQLTGRHRYNSVERDGDISVDINKTYNYYDNLGNLMLTENFDSSDSYGLRIYSDEHFTYNLDYTSQQTQLPKPNAFYFNEDILNRSPLYPIKTYERYGYEQGENRRLIDREEYFYSDISTSTQEINLTKLDVKLSPNPAQDFVQLRFDDSVPFSDVSIFDLNGKRVADINNYSSGDKIKIDALEPGVYFYRVSRKDGKASGQFVKL